VGFLVRGLLGFEDEAASLYRFDAAMVIGAVFVNQLGLALEDVGVFSASPWSGWGVGLPDVAEVFRKESLLAARPRGRGPFFTNDSSACATTERIVPSGRREEG